MTASRATCAAARDTRTSSRPCWPRRRQVADDRHRGTHRLPRSGAPRRRKEDARLITGRTRWTDNIELPGMLHIAMVRSPFAHATITSIDTSAAKAAPGVHRRAHRCRHRRRAGRELPCAWPITRGQKAPPHPAMAVDRVDFAGEIVAVHRGADARPRPATPPSWSTSTTTSCRRRSTWPPPPRTRSSPIPTSARTCRPRADLRLGRGRHRRRRRRGDREGQRRIVIEREYRQQRLIPAFMEPRSVVVDPTGEQTDDLVVDPGPALPQAHAGARRSGSPRPSSASIAPDVGGGFGGKLQFTPEEVHHARREPPDRASRASTPRPAASR